MNNSSISVVFNAGIFILFKTAASNLRRFFNSFDFLVKFKFLSIRSKSKSFFWSFVFSKPLERHFKIEIVSLKEIKLRPGTEIHDYNFKIKNAKKFITKGDKVKFTVKFKGREMQHVELGKNLMSRIIEDTKDIAKVETHPKFEGRQMIMIIQPN